jgi:hypothetical protein
LRDALPSASIAEARAICQGLPVHGQALLAFCPPGVTMPTREERLAGGPIGLLVSGIAGLGDGIAAIPHRWRDGLRGTEVYAPLLERLTTRDTGR